MKELILTWKTRKHRGHLSLRLYHVFRLYHKYLCVSCSQVTQHPHWTYSKDNLTGAEYIALSNRIGRGDAVKTKQLREGLLIDLDHEGKVIGVEILT